MFYTLALSNSYFCLLISNPNLDQDTNYTKQIPTVTIAQTYLRLLLNHVLHEYETTEFHNGNKSGQ